MKATELKKRYPEFWAEIEDEVERGFTAPTTVGAIAHNAAFTAALCHHRALMAMRKAVREAMR